MQFDAYHEWLGISEREQPPHHYRLQVIDLFETNANVIDHAADRQMTHLRALAKCARAETVIKASSRELVKS